MDDFVAGGAAALAAITIMHPVDVVKSRLQMQGEQAARAGQPPGANSAAYRGVFSSLRAIASKEGVAGLYRGIVPAYALQFAVTATRFGVYAAAKRVAAQHDEVQSGPGASNSNSSSSSSSSSTLRNFGLAAAAGACGGVLGNPFFAIKTRAQVFSSAKDLAVGTQHQPEGLWRSFIGIYRQEGLAGYTRGMNAFVPRVVVYGAAQLGVYDATKPALQRHLGLQEGIQLQLSSAFIASVAAVVVIQPFDFLSARLQNQAVDPVTRKGKLYSGLVDCAVKSIRNEGPGCLLKGCWANVCRMGPYSVMVLMFFEQSKRLVQLAHSA